MMPTVLCCQKPMACRRLTQRICLLGWLLWSAASLAGTVAAASPAQPPPDLSQTLRGVEKRYNSMKSMKAEFMQIYRQGGQATRQERGVLYLSKPGKMRWEYQEPEAKLFLTNGKETTLFLPSENRVMQAPIKQSEDLRAPLAFLLGRLNFGETFGRYETSPDLRPLDPGDTVFRAYPKQPGGQVQWVLFEITPDDEISRIAIHEVGGTETEFQFSQEQSNPTLAASLFEFTPPPGTQVVKE